MTAQEEFDAKYVSSTELCRDLGVSRMAVMKARGRGALPEPVRVTRPDGSSHIMLWDRKELEPHLAKWRAELEGRTGA